MALLVFSTCASSVSAQERGKIAGVVVDAETGETLIGANVVLAGTTTGSTTDLDGRYEIPNLAPGLYALQFSYVGYNPATVENVEVNAGATTRLDVSLASEAIEVGEVFVEARAVRDSEAALLRERQKAAAVSDAISAEAIGRSGSSSAADAMRKVTGAAVVGGKYVYVRGLGDRYMTTQLNGAELPTADPDRNAVAFDLFPAGLLDNIVTTKTFTPDKPGNFTGGSVNISTKDYPEVFNLSVSSSLSYNSNIGVGGDFLSYSGGTVGVFGDNGGAHRLPAALRDPNVEIPPLGEAFTDPVKARQLDRLSKAFDQTMTPAVFSAPVNRNYSLSIGNQMRLFGRPLGVVGGVSYARSRTGYAGGTTARYQLTGKVAEVDGLNNDFRFEDVKGVDEVLWGGLVNASYKLHPRHELGLNYLYNKSAESTARFQHGSFPRDLSPDAVYETRVLRFVERSLNSVQGRGEHAFGKTKLTWNTTYARSRQDEPDLRYFTNNFSVVERGGVVDTLYTVQASIYPVPTRYFRTLEEDGWTSNLDYSIPVRSWNGLQGRLKAGGSYTRKVRSFRERRFEFRTDSRAGRYAGDPETFFGVQNVGILEDQSTDRFFRFGNYVVDASQPSSNYDGKQTIAAAYVMAEWPLTRRLRLIAGVRYETTDIEVASLDTSLARGRLADRDWLPSANLIYRLSDRMNLRLAYGRTLARPVFRELAPYASFAFVGDYIFIGNPALRRTLIDNLDVRWEWFLHPGEILAVSGFHKSFRNPIERAVNPIAAAANPEVQFRNVDRANVTGLEFEARKNLGGVAGVFRHLQVGGNVSLVHSSVDIAPDELALVRAFDPSAPASRPLLGQSGYTVNVDATYDNPTTGTTLSVYYNVFGKRLDKVSIGGTPDIYEKPQNVVDLTFKQRIWRGLDLRFAAKNLLDARFRLAHDFKGREYVTQEYRLGRSYSLGVSFRP
ncbi:TonB-dependent receptor domain-containing protein [Rhodocaloribacter sp.]